MDDSRRPDPEPPHDILAAEMFAVPAPDPRLHELHAEPPHDVLAAEMFVVPAPDPRLHRAPLSLPDDLTGTTQPSDVLIAEEFPMPAPPEVPPHAHDRDARSDRGTPWLHSAAGWVLLILFVALSVRRGRRNRRAR